MIELLVIFRFYWAYLASEFSTFLYIPLPSWLQSEGDIVTFQLRTTSIPLYFAYSDKSLTCLSIKQKNPAHRQSFKYVDGGINLCCCINIRLVSHIATFITKYFSFCPYFSWIAMLPTKVEMFLKQPRIFEEYLYYGNYNFSYYSFFLRGIWGLKVVTICYY